MSGRHAPGAASQNRDVFHCCQELRTLNLPNAARARALLQRAADHARPVMARRKWRVPVLREFFPKDGRLLGLNVNAGTEIRVRLRPARDKNDFLPYENVLKTLLHELAHIERGPHDAAFYRLLDELIQETLQTKETKFPGLGQVAGRRRLGGSAGPAAAAAEAARKRAGVAQGGGGRLGGQVRRGSPKWLAAQAAQRRAEDELTCGRVKTVPKGSEAPAKGSKAGGSEDVVIVLDGDDVDEVVVDLVMPAGVEEVEVIDVE